MSKSAVTTEQASHNPKKTGCCGGDHGKDEKAPPAQKGQAIPIGAHNHEHAGHSAGESDCCGGSKKKK